KSHGRSVSPDRRRGEKDQKRSGCKGDPGVEKCIRQLDFPRLPSFSKKHLLTIMNDWIELSTEEYFNNLLERSVKKPQIIFKDSVTCGISAYAKERLIQQYDLLQGKADF